MTKHDLQTYQAAVRELRYLKHLEREVGLLDEATAQVLTNTKQRLADHLQRIEDAIASLDPTERTILRMRYVEGESWTKIELTVHYSRSAVFELHNKALQKLGENNTTKGEGNEIN